MPYRHWPETMPAIEAMRNRRRRAARSRLWRVTITLTVYYAIWAAGAVAAVAWALD